MSVVMNGQAAVAGLLAAGGFVGTTKLMARGRAVPVGRISELTASERRGGIGLDPVGASETKSSAARWFRRMMSVASLAGTRRGAIVALGVGLLAAIAGLSVAPASAAVAVVVVGNRISSAHRRRVEQAFDAALPDLVDGMTAALRSGSTVRVALLDSAVGVPGTLSADVDMIATRLDRGEGLAESLAWWARWRGRPQLDVLAAVVATSTEFGGPLADVLTSVADQMRDDLRSRDEVRAQSAQAVASAGMLIVLPLVSVAITAIADPRVVGFLFSTPLGMVCLAVGLLLEVVGAWWMSSLVRWVR